MRPVRLTRAQQQALTRERLLAAAERVLARHGYGGASIDLITAEAGYSKGAIYSNFESKEAVFLELLRVYMERDMAELGRIVSLAPQQLSAALNAWLETMHCDSDCPLLVTELQLHARRNPAYNRDVLGNDDMPPLNTPEGATWLMREIEVVKPDLIIFDSIMCLLAGAMSEEAARCGARHSRAGSLSAIETVRRPRRRMPVPPGI